MSTVVLGNFDDFVEQIIINKGISQGPQGIPGPQGPRGNLGPRGFTGPAGADGADGTSVNVVNVTSNVDKSITITWSDGTVFTTPSLIGPQGLKGDKGDKGEDGASVTIDHISSNGDYTFTIEFSDGTSYTTDNLRGLPGAVGATGPKGAIGDTGPMGPRGPRGPQGVQGPQGLRGIDGVSIHHMELTSTTDPEGNRASAGETDTYTVWGDNAETINMGYFQVYNGADGKDSYRQALDRGFTGSVNDWLNSLVGKSAYQSAVDNGYAGTEADWIAELIPETLTLPVPVPVAVGGIPVGTTYTNARISDVLIQLLNPYFTPAFTNFSIGVSEVEVGGTLNGPLDCTWTIANAQNIVPGSIKITSITGGSVDLATGLSNTGSASVTMTTGITKNTGSTHQFRISATDIKGTMIRRNVTVSWVYNVYYGESNSDVITETEVEALRMKVLTGNKAGSYPMIGGGYKWICIPAAYGALSTFKDPSTNFEVAMNPVQVVSITSPLGIITNYNCYRTFNTLGSGLTIAAN